MYYFQDFVTKKKQTPHNLIFTGTKHPWEIIQDIDVIRKKINLPYFKNSAPCLSKYLPLLPIEHPADFISLGNQATPLIKSKHIGPKLGINLYFKVEGKNPTGSFKDRGSAVEISIAKEKQAQGIVLASTGNMAASCACYAAAANIPCFVIVPEEVAMAKLAQVISFNGKIVQVKGNYNDAEQLAYAIAKDTGFYLAGDYAFRVEGQKTAVFEIIDQLNFHAPDIIIIPVGCGTNLAAYYKGLIQYQQLNLINHLPKLIGAQAAGASAVVNSVQNNCFDKITALKNTQTIASAIAVPNPIDGLKALEAIKQTHGSAYAITDIDMLAAKHELSTQEGLFVETAAASTLASLYKMHQAQNLPQQTIVCVLSGEGLKDPSLVLKTAIKPPSIAPNLKSFKALFDKNFFNSKNMLFIDDTQVLFSTVPALSILGKKLEELFGFQYTSEQLQTIHNILASILQQGKNILLSDLQDSLQSALETNHAQRHNQLFKVKHFSVTASKGQSSQASVTVCINKQIYTAQHSGVGPVDAVIKALRVACYDNLEFELTNYKVDIRGQGVDAVVYAELKLIQAGIVSLGRATSPDIIQASISAFAHAYNHYLETQSQEPVYEQVS